LLESKSVQLIITSPPYADARKKQYGGIKPDDYVQWFLAKSKEFYRVLDDKGTFILNIKEKVVNKERHTYVLDLIKELKGQGWLWTEEFIWHKKTSAPGKWPNRFRDSWERLLQFNKSTDFNMYQEAVKVPAAPATLHRMNNLSEKDKTPQASGTGSGITKNLSNCCHAFVYPTNVLHLSPTTNNKGHPATFPVDLPAWFIKLFTKEGDTVLDPFMGSGTTFDAAYNLRRNCVGVEVQKEYVQLILNKLCSRHRINSNDRVVYDAYHCNS
jgi:DNA modification methylase